MAPPSAATGGRWKRKKPSAAPENNKRLKTGGDGEGMEGYVHPPRSPRISMLHNRLQQPVTLNELTELLHYAALGKTGGIPQPSWCRLHHQRKVKGVNVVIVDGLTQTDFYKHYLTLQHLRTNYHSRVTFIPSSQNIASEIFSSEVSNSNAPSLPPKKESVKIPKALRHHPVILKFGPQTRGLTAYLLPLEEMIKRRYPVKGIPGFEDFVCTDSVDRVTDSSPLYGLDCEMCVTEKGNELTRVSLVDSDGNCVLDELVKPENRILDYVTRFSGITPAMLRPVKTTLREIQAKIRALLPWDAVLVGHSVNGDLCALKLIHPHVIDTSLLYRKEFGQRFKLKVLAEIVLKRLIQTEKKKGHDSTEDAAAALELAQYFIKEGPLQVLEHHLEELWGCKMEEEEEEEEEEEVEVTVSPTPTPSLRFADVLQTLGRTVAFIGKRSVVALDLSNQQWHNSDKEVLDSYRKLSQRSFLSVLKFSSFSDHVKRCVPNHEQQRYQRVCADLRDMCVVFAGPFPAGFSQREAKRFFRCCGPVRKIKMLNTAVRVHAEVEFELLEGAVLALKMLNGLRLQGQSVKVQRPVNESMLDLDETLDALTGDALNTSSLYAIKTKLSANISPKVNGHTLGSAERPGASAVKAADGPCPTKGHKEARELTEETLGETFGSFGAVQRIDLPAKPGKYARHASIKFESSHSKDAALSFSEALSTENYAICPALTPSHLCSWVSLATTVDAEGEDTEKNYLHNSLQDQQMELTMRKLDRCLGKIFKSLPHGTLSVVVLPGHSGAHGELPGLCFLEVKSGPGGEQ